MKFTVSGGLFSHEIGAKGSSLQSPVPGTTPEYPIPSDIASPDPSRKVIKVCISQLNVTSFFPLLFLQHGLCLSSIYVRVCSWHKLKKVTSVIKIRSTCINLKLGEMYIFIIDK